MNLGWLSNLFSRIGAPAGASVSADVAAVKVDSAAIITDLDNATDGLGALKALIDTAGGVIDSVQTDTTAIISDLDNATDGLGALKAEIDANETKIDTIDGIVDDLKEGGGFGADIVRKSITFDGATLNAIGDFDGTGNPADIFTVTGQVIARVVAVCTTSLTFDANATIEVGITASPSGIIATTDLTVEALAAKEIWHDATPDSELEAMSTMRDYIVTDGNDIILTCGVANTNTGVIEFYCLYTALSSDGAVTAA